MGASANQLGGLLLWRGSATHCSLVQSATVLCTHFNSLRLAQGDASTEQSKRGVHIRNEGRARIRGVQAFRAGQVGVGVAAGAWAGLRWVARAHAAQDLPLPTETLGTADFCAAALPDCAATATASG